jgi:hypothetical protein
MQYERKVYLGLSASEENSFLELGARIWVCSQIPTTVKSKRLWTAEDLNILMLQKFYF